jgi:RNA polymerase sigma-70 factor (ECF subfamily)
MGIFGNTYKQCSDEELMDLMCAGNKKALDELYGRYASILLRFFLKMLGNDREKSEDFVHDFFAKIIQNPTLFDSSRSFKTWCFAVANNMCKNEYKKIGVRQYWSNSLDASIGEVDRARNVDQQVHESIFQEAFSFSLANLDDKHKMVFSLRHMDGLTIKEIAEKLEINEGTIKSRLFYATKYLAENLKEYNPVEIH